MDSKTAFYTIKLELESRAEIEVIRADYDEKSFGNFVVEFLKGGAPSSFVLDRGELVICQGLNASHGCKTVLPAIQELSKEHITAAVTSCL
jgi:hypothetical protein